MSELWTGCPTLGQTTLTNQDNHNSGGRRLERPVQGEEGE